MTDPLAEWVRTVHAALATRAVPCRSARWGPVVMAHCTTRPDWYAGMDDAWACAPDGEVPDLDVISAAFDDLPEGLEPPPVRNADLGPRGEVRSAPDSPVRLIWGQRSGEVLGWDPDSGCAVLLRTRPPSGYDLVSPMRWLVHWGVAAAGGVLMHAAAVGRAEGESVRGALLIGDAGHGKSTTTLACLANGWMTCGDDAVAVFPQEGRWYAAAVYAAVKTKLAPAGPAPEDLPEAGVESVTWEIEGTKRAHLLTSTDERTLCERIELDALILLEPDADPEAACSPVTAPAARTRATPSTLLTLPFERESTLRRIGRLAQQVPAWTLPRRTTMARAVEDVAAILDRCRPWISVVIPLFDGERYVQGAVESVLAQTRGRFQIIVVDDAGSESTLARVEAMREKIAAAGHRLDAVVHERNRGVGAARNSGADVAIGDFVTWLDQDDLWPPERTAHLLAALDAGDAAVAQGRMRMVDVAPGVPRPWLRDNWFGQDHPGLVMGALLCRAEVLAEVGPFDESLANGADDTDWFMRLRHAGLPTVEVDTLSVIRQIHETNQMRNLGTAVLLDVVRTHLARRRASGTS